MAVFVPRDYTNGEQVNDTDMDRIDQGIVEAHYPLVTGKGLPGRIRAGRVDQGVAISSWTFTMFDVSRGITVTHVTSDFYAITGTGGKLRAAIYQRPTDSSIGALVASLAVLPVSSADVTIATGGVVIEPGTYWIVGHYDGEGTLTGVSNRRPTYLGIGSTTSTQWSHELQKTASAWPGSWPTNLTGVGDTQVAIPGNTWQSELDYCPFILTWTQP